MIDKKILEKVTDKKILIANALWEARINITITTRDIVFFLISTICFPYLEHSAKYTVTVLILKLGKSSLIGITDGSYVLSCRTLLSVKIFETILHQKVHTKWV